MLLQVANLTFGDLLAHITSNRETYCPQNNWEYEAEGNSEKKKRPAAYITYIMQHTPILRRPYEKEYVAPLSFDPSFRSRMLETLGNSFIPPQFQLQFLLVCWAPQSRAFALLESCLLPSVQLFLRGKRSSFSPKSYRDRIHAG